MNEELWEEYPFSHTLHTVIYYSFIVCLCVCCTVLATVHRIEIKRLDKLLHKQHLVREQTHHHLDNNSNNK